MASGRGADKTPLPPPLPSPQCSYILFGVNFALFKPSCKLGCHVEAKHLHGESTSSAGEKHEKLVLMKPFFSAEFDDILILSYQISYNICTKVAQYIMTAIFQMSTCLCNPSSETPRGLLFAAVTLSSIQITITAIGRLYLSSFLNIYFQSNLQVLL